MSSNSYAVSSALAYRSRRGRGLAFSLKSGIRSYAKRVLNRKIRHESKPSLNPLDEVIPTVIESTTDLGDTGYRITPRWAIPVAPLEFSYENGPRFCGFCGCDVSPSSVYSVEEPVIQYKKRRGYGPDYDGYEAQEDPT